MPTPDTGEVIALLVDEDAGSHGWPGRLAVHLANRWAEADLPVLLADGDLSGASLHQLVGMQNDEGVSDLILYGASNARVSQKLDDGGPLFVPSGTPVSDPEIAYLDPRWSVVISEMRTAGTVLLLYLPADSTGASDLAEEADRVIRLVSSPPDDPDPDLVWVHVSGEDAHPDEVASIEGTGDGAQNRDQTSADTSVGGTPPTPVVSKDRGTKRRVPLPVLLTLLVLIAVMIAMVWLGLIEIPGITVAASLSYGPDLPMGIDGT